MREYYSTAELDFIRVGIRDKEASDAFLWLQLELGKAHEAVDGLKRCANCTNYEDVITLGEKPTSRCLVKGEVVRPSYCCVDWGRRCKDEDR